MLPRRALRLRIAAALGFLWARCGCAQASRLQRRLLTALPGGVYNPHGTPEGLALVAANQPLLSLSNYSSTLPLTA